MADTPMHKVATPAMQQLLQLQLLLMLIGQLLLLISCLLLLQLPLLQASQLVQLSLLLSLLGCRRLRPETVLGRRRRCRRRLLQLGVVVCRYEQITFTYNDSQGADTIQ